MELKITEHFSYNEMTDTASHPELLAENREKGTGYLQNLCDVCGELEKVREFTQKPVHVLSGFRCLALNAAVKGSATSQHLAGQAADFTVDGYSDAKGLRFIFDWCGHHLTFGQLILEIPEGRTPWIHVGLLTPGKAPERLMWDGAKYERV